MKKINKSLMSVAILTAGLLSASAAFANDVHFPPGQERGSFSCTVSNLSEDAIVAIDTHNVDVQGFCGGQYVTGKGHLQIPASDAAKIFNTYYFQTRKKLANAGSISATLISGTGNITCASGHGSASSPFRSGDNYCALPPSSN